MIVVAFATTIYLFCDITCGSNNINRYTRSQMSSLVWKINCLKMTNIQPEFTFLLQVHMCYHLATNQNDFCPFEKPALLIRYSGEMFEMLSVQLGICVWVRYRETPHILPYKYHTISTLQSVLPVQQTVDGFTCFLFHFIFLSICRHSLLEGFGWPFPFQA